jgi:hypothetical protein
VDGTDGIRRSGIGFAWNNRRDDRASQRANSVARLFRALSVEIPVFAYICRYSFEMNRNAKRLRMEETHSDRFQMNRKL